MTSFYKQDYGNGVVVYADDFVKTGKWVFDCSNSRLVSRRPLAVPLGKLEEFGPLTIDAMYYLKESDREQEKIAIMAITEVNGWYNKLNYNYSHLSENSKLNLHIFGFLANHDGRQWAFKVWQWVDSRDGSRFEITAKPYDPETYMDYARSLQAAAKSCPVPQ
jgi:hypothetical protein